MRYFGSCLYKTENIVNTEVHLALTSRATIVNVLYELWLIPNLYQVSFSKNKRKRLKPPVVSYLLLLFRLLTDRIDELKANLKASDSFHHQVLISLTLSIF